MGKSFKMKNGLKTANNLFTVNQQNNKAKYHGEELATVEDLKHIDSNWITINSDYNAKTGDKILADTSGGSFTIVLPPSPVFGDNVQISDLNGTFEANNLMVDRNGENIMSLPENMGCDLNNLTFELVFVNESEGWKIIFN